MKRKPPSDRRLRRALAFAYPHRRAVGMIFLVTLVVAAINAVEPLVLKRIFDHLGTSKGRSVVLEGVAALVALALVRELAGGFTNWQTWRTRLGIHYTLLEETIDRLHCLPLNMQRAEGVGAIMTRLDRGIAGSRGSSAR